MTPKWRLFAGGRYTLKCRGFGRKGGKGLMEHGRCSICELFHKVNRTRDVRVIRKYRIRRFSALGYRADFATRAIGYARTGCCWPSAPLGRAKGWGGRGYDSEALHSGFRRAANGARRIGTRTWSVRGLRGWRAWGETGTKKGRERCRGLEKAGTAGTRAAEARVPGPAGGGSVRLVPCADREQAGRAGTI